MKSWICLLCVVMLFLSSCSVPEATISTTPEIDKLNGTQGLYELTFHTKQLSNHSVGEDWSFKYTYNGQVIKNGYRIAQPLNLFSFLSVEVEVHEKDKIDDIATGTLYIAICDGGSGRTEITVTENAGPYKGNTAVWEITCEVALAEKQ